MSDGTLDSWEERVDWALGQAGRVLGYAAEQFVSGAMDTGTADAASTLAESFRDLATHWADRSGLVEEVPEEEDEDEPVAARLAGQEG